MTDSIALPTRAFLPAGTTSLADIVVAQPLASAIVAFFLFYALVTLLARFANWLEPPPGLARAARRADPPAPKIWRCRKPA